MPFVKGQSGNPAGRKPKPKTGPDKLRQDLLRQAPEILAALVEQAKAGDVAAAQAVLSRCLPALRPTDRPVPLPLPCGTTDLGEAANAVLDGLAVGSLTIDQASGMASVLTALARVQESAELTDRVAALEVAVNRC
jgi:hypothetical protein